MTRMLGDYQKPQRMKKCQRYGCCWEPPQHTRGGVRLRERRQWLKDQEMPYYWRPTADIFEDYEEDPDPRHGPAGWAWRILQGEEEGDG